MKTAEYMAQFIGDEFPATIAGVTSFGFFVELENSVEGLVHVSSLDDDYYQYMEDQHCLIGERLKKRYRLGDAVTVRLIRSNPVDRSIDFTLASSPVTRRPNASRPGSADRFARKPGKAKSSSQRKKTEVKTSVGKTQKHKDRRRKP